METPRNMFTALVAASLLILAAADTHLRDTLIEPPSPNSDELLRHVYYGLDVLYQVSVYELMDKVNISSRVNISNPSETDVIFSALDITCDLHRANTDLIPSIENSTYGDSPVTQVLKMIGEASMNYSCQWLGDAAQEQSSEDAAVNCDELPEICKRWDSIKEYKEAKSNINQCKSNTITSTESAEDYTAEKDHARQY